jgi:hypothetical protein
MKTLKDITKFLSTIENIDNGGCGIAALAVYRWLIKHNKHKGIKIVYLYEDCCEKNSDKNCEIIASKNPHKQPICPCHVALKRNNRFIDDKGFRSEDEIFEWFIEYHDVTIDFLLKTVNRIRTWNNDFNRSKYIPILESSLGIDLSDVKVL